MKIKIFLFILGLLCWGNQWAMEPVSLKLQATKVLVDRLITEAIELGDLTELINFFHYPDDIASPFVSRLEKSAKDLITALINQAFMSNDLIRLNQLDQFPDPVKAIVFKSLKDIEQEHSLIALTVIERSLSENDFKQWFQIDELVEPIRTDIICNVVYHLARLLAKNIQISLESKFPHEIFLSAKFLNEAYFNPTAALLNVYLNKQLLYEEATFLRSVFIQCGAQEDAIVRLQSRFLDKGIEFADFIKDFTPTSALDNELFRIILLSELGKKLSDFEIGKILQKNILLSIMFREEMRFRSVLQALKNIGFDINKSTILYNHDTYISPLIYSIFLSKKMSFNRDTIKKMIEMLIENGADINTATPNGLTPLGVTKDDLQLHQLLINLSFQN